MLLGNGAEIWLTVMRCGAQPAQRSASRPTQATLILTQKFTSCLVMYGSFYGDSAL